MSRILLVNNLDLSINNGATKHFLDLYNEFKNSGIDISVFTRVKPLLLNEENSNDFVSIPSIYPKNLGVLGSFIMVFTFELMVLLKLLINTEKEFDGIYLRQSILNFGVLIYAGLFKTDFIIECNSLIVEDIRENNRKGIERIESLLERKNFSKCKHIRTVSLNIKTYLKEKYNLKENKISYIPNGFNFDNLKPFIEKADSNFINKEMRFLYLGNLHSREGIHILLKAVKLINSRFKFKLIIAGEGPYKSNLKNLVKELEIESLVDFIGSVPRKNVSDEIQKSDICFAPLIKKRNIITGVSPIKVYEYLAHKKPIICSDLPGLEFIKIANAGLLFEPDNIKDLLNKIIDMIDNWENSQVYALNGYKYVKKNYNWSSLAKKIIDISLNSFNINPNL